MRQTARTQRYREMTPTPVKLEYGVRTAEMEREPAGVRRSAASAQWTRVESGAGLRKMHAPLLAAKGKIELVRRVQEVSGLRDSPGLPWILFGAQGRDRSPEGAAWPSARQHERGEQPGEKARGRTQDRGVGQGQSPFPTISREVGGASGADVSSERLEAAEAGRSHGTDYAGGASLPDRPL